MIPRTLRLATATAVLVGLCAAPALADTTGPSNTDGLDALGRGRPPRAGAPPRSSTAVAAIKALGQPPRRRRRAQRPLPRPLHQDPDQDKTAWLSEEGQLFYREEMPALDEETPAEGVEAPTPPGEAPSVDISPGAIEAGHGLRHRQHHHAGVPRHPDLQAAQPPGRHPRDLPRLRRRRGEGHRLEHRLQPDRRRGVHRLRQRREDQHLQHCRERLDAGGLAPGRRDLRALRRRRDHRGRRP